MSTKNKGGQFENRVQTIAAKYFNTKFVQGKNVAIGNPPKNHSFDLVSKDDKIIIECKCYSWTKTDKVPSAKISILDEAVLYMRSAPAGSQKIIVMDKAYSTTHKCTLAKYFVDKKGHLLEDVKVVEIDENDEFRFYELR